jgi:hypothetical protein
MFSRSFTGSFIDSPENIQHWLQQSPGVVEGRRLDEVKYLLKMIEESFSGELTISEKGSQVHFRFSS